MAWNNGFPATYGQVYPAYNPQGQFYPQTQPQQPMAGTQMPQPNQAPAMMTPPTIRAEIVQVEDEKTANAFPVGAGASQMMIARDESAIYIKSALPNGQSIMTIYDKRAPEPPAPAFNPGEYVRKDELEDLVYAAIAAQQPAQATQVTPKRAVKREEG